MTESADWGDIAGDAVIFGGAVSNAHAFEALVAAAQGRALLSTGDTIGYCGEPARTVRLMRGAAVRSIRGNCEESVVAGASGCGCGFEAGSACDLAALRWFAHALADLGPADRAWMAALPVFATVGIRGRRWGLLHGAVSAINCFLWPGDPETVFLDEIARFEALAGPVDGIVAGHSGMPFVATPGRWTWVNTGALGLPGHDGDRRTSYTVIGPAGPRIVRLDYDWQGAVEAMRDAGLTQGYERTLETGWWPSEEILPERLRRRGP